MPTSFNSASATKYFNWVLFTVAFLLVGGLDSATYAQQKPSRHSNGTEQLAVLEQSLADLKDERDLAIEKRDLIQYARPDLLPPSIENVLKAARGAYPELKDLSEKDMRAAIAKRWGAGDPGLFNLFSEPALQNYMITHPGSGDPGAKAKAAAKIAILEKAKNEKRAIEVIRELDRKIELLEKKIEKKKQPTDFSLNQANQQAASGLEVLHQFNRSGLNPQKINEESRQNTRPEKVQLPQTGDVKTFSTQSSGADALR